MTTTMGKFARRFAFGSALLMAAAGAAASPSITNLDGTFDPFGGFDWSKAGNVITSGPIVNGGTVTSTFWANAIAINDTSSNPFTTPNLFPPNGSGTYEYTSLATVTETVTCSGAIGDPCGSSATFTATSGSWTIYYDTSPNSNLITGAGITDGVTLLSGDVTSGGGTFNLVGGGGGGFFSYIGTVTNTNNTYINPDLLGTTAFSTLQFGNLTTSWTAPTSQPGANGGTTAIPAGTLSFQADANQSFTQTTVPEPGTLALLAAAILGIGFVRRRSK